MSDTDTNNIGRNFIFFKTDTKNTQVSMSKIKNFCLSKFENHDDDECASRSGKWPLLCNTQSENTFLTIAGVFTAGSILINTRVGLPRLKGLYNAQATLHAPHSR